jgi:hypothetical protein
VTKRAVLEVRKPKKTIDPSEVAAFVQNGESKPAARRKAAPTAEEKRRLTVYVPSVLAKRLRMFCATNETDLSEATTAALEAYLAKK